ncbi:hypothetical protein BKA69DRAFT_1088277 [Paraphysoderma sedebokerense]|nr:hypothetical protein BKA69DRAFT_1088277 [Paraphysoderma sedebokerense]
MEFSGFGVFPVQPGRWFDGGIISQFGKHVVQPKSFSESESDTESGSGSGFQFFGENGTMPGLVSAIVVGYKPKIVVQFDKQGYQEIWQAWSLQKKMIENGLTGNSNLTNNATLTNSTGNLNETTTDLNTAANTTTSQAPELFVGPFKVNVPAENQLGEKSATVTGFIPTFKNDSQTLVLSNGNDALPVILGYIGKKFQL